MGLLLDTHYVFALAGAPGRLSQREIHVLRDPPAALVVSAVSIWEIRLKWDALHGSGARKGPRGPADILEVLARQNITFLNLSYTHAATPLLVALPHRDPFDAILLVQAQTEGHLMLTRDAKLLPHPLAISAEAAR